MPMIKSHVQGLLGIVFMLSLLPVPSLGATNLAATKDCAKFLRGEDATDNFKSYLADLMEKQTVRRRGVDPPNPGIGTGGTR